MSNGKQVQRRLAGLLLGGALLAAQTACASSLPVVDHGFSSDDGTAPPARSAAGAAGADAGVMVLMQQLDRYEQRIQDLQNQVEILRHEVNTLKSAARERYLDLDTRINALVEQVQGTPTTDAEAGDSGGNTRPPADPQADKEAYVAARGKLLERDFPAAAAAFEGYLAEFPHGQFRAHAHFWLGEIYSNQKQPDLAAARQQFQIVVDQYPDHSKAPTSLYKLASLDARAGDTAKAKVALNRLIKQFPNSSEAKLAKAMLAQLNGQ